MEETVGWSEVRPGPEALLASPKELGLFPQAVGCLRVSAGQGSVQTLRGQAC